MVGMWVVAILFLIGGGVGLLVLNHETGNDGTVIGCVGSTAGVIFGLMIIVGLATTGEPKPEALDVYRGKTTLQITYQDSVALDSTVVWKPEFKPED